MAALSWQEIRAKFLEGADKYPDMSAQWDPSEDRWTFCDSRPGEYPQPGDPQSEAFFKECCRLAVTRLGRSTLTPSFQSWLDLMRTSKRGFIHVIQPHTFREFRQIMEAQAPVDTSHLPKSASGGIHHVFKESAEFCADLHLAPSSPDKNADQMLTSRLREIDFLGSEGRKLAEDAFIDWGRAKLAERQRRDEYAFKMRKYATGALQSEFITIHEVLFPDSRVNRNPWPWAELIPTALACELRNQLGDFGQRWAKAIQRRAQEMVDSIPDGVNTEDLLRDDPAAANWYISTRIADFDRELRAVVTGNKPSPEARIQWADGGMKETMNVLVASVREGKCSARDVEEQIDQMLEQFGTLERELRREGKTESAKLEAARKILEVNALQCKKQVWEIERDLRLGAAPNETQATPEATAEDKRAGGKSRRRERAEAFLARVNEHLRENPATGLDKAFKTDIRRAAGYRDHTVYKDWEKLDSKIKDGSATDKSIDDVLKMPTDRFIKAAVMKRPQKKS